MMRGLHFGQSQGFPSACFDAFGVGTAVSGVANAAATIGAASMEADAVNNATNLQQQRYDTTRGDLLPYNQAGQNANLLASNNLGTYSDTGASTVSALNGAMPTAQNNSVVPGRMTEAELEQTPGYQFDLSQGQQAVAS